MAEKTIGMLVPATDIFPTDLFLVEQSGVAKNVPGQVMINFLTRVADGHGGVTDFKQLSISGREKTYQFTMADQTTYSFTVTDGNDIADFQHSVSGLVHTCKFIMDDGTEYSFSVSDGAKGDKGDNAYVHIRFASEKPTSSSSSMGTEPDAWIGFYSGNKEVAPTNPLEYTWAPFKGEQGTVGSPATLATAKVEYQVGTSGTVEPSGQWTVSVPVTEQGKYLWVRVTIQFNSGSPIQFYSISYMGVNGTGAVTAVNGVNPDENGIVRLTAADVGALDINGGTMKGPINMNGQKITGLNTPVEDSEPETKGHASETFLLKDEAESYLQKTEAQNTYLSIQDAGTTYQKKSIKQTGITVQTSSFRQDSTYSADGYAYRAQVPVSGATSQMFPTVVFSPGDAASGNLATVANPYNGGVYIYAKKVPSAAVSILTVKLEEV